MPKVYSIMCGELEVAKMNIGGKASVMLPDRMPFDLWLEEGDDVDTLVNNITNFNFWCASRVLTLDREYAKEILNSIGASQGRTDKERAMIALSYHCLTLTDIYWVKDESEDVSFEELNLYENHLDNAFVDVSLKGRAMTVENAHLIADDISTSGVFPKAWVRTDDGFYLYKDGNPENVNNELLASKIVRCFDCRQVEYEPYEYEGEVVSSSRIMTNLELSIVTRAAFDIYAVNHDLNPIEEIIRIDAHGYYMMNILDYLVGNTDRHWENWGLFIDNKSGKILRLHDLMDFNQAFKAYDNIDGALCQTTLPRHISQKDAAIEAVKKIGLNQIKDIDLSVFGCRDDIREMFEKRLDILKNI